MKNNFGFAILLAIIAICFLPSCRSGKEKQSIYRGAFRIEYEDFGETHELKAKQTGAWDSLVLASSQLYVCSNSLMIKNRMSDKAIDCYDLESGEKIASHISIGQGPEELLMPGFAGEERESIFISDLVNSSVSQYDTNDFLNEDEPVLKKRLHFQKHVTGEIKLLEKNKFVGAVSHNPALLFYVFDMEGSVLDSLGSYPDADWEATDAERFNMYSSAFATDGKGRIVVCHNWTDLIDIYAKDGRLYKRLHGPLHFVSHFKEFNDGRVVSSSRVKGETRDAYFCPVSVDDEFWVLFSGKSEWEDGYNILCEQILVFGWDGTPHRILKLDEGIFAFSVDKLRRKIYGISNSPEYHIVIFDY